MKSSKDKSKSPKPKPKFQGLPPKKNNDSNSITPASVIRPGTPRPLKAFVEGVKSVQVIKEDQPPTSTENDHHLKKDVWIKVKTIDQNSGNPHTLRPPQQTHKHKTTVQTKEPAETTTTKLALKDDGHTISLTNLVPPPSLGKDLLYDSNGSIEDFPNSTIELAVEKGVVFFPTNTRQRPEHNSFAKTSDLGPPQAQRRWLIDMGNFRDGEITFTLDGRTLMIEGNQSTRPGKVRNITETVSLPINFDIQNFRVYRNRQVGTLVLAYLPQY